MLGISAFSLNVGIAHLHLMLSETKSIAALFHLSDFLVFCWVSAWNDVESAQLKGSGTGFAGHLGVCDSKFTFLLVRKLEAMKNSFLTL